MNGPSDAAVGAIVAPGVLVAGLQSLAGIAWRCRRSHPTHLDRIARVSTEAKAALDAGRAAVETRRWLEGYELLRPADARDLLDAVALEAHAGAAAQVDDDHGACGEPADALATSAWFTAS